MIMLVLFSSVAGMLLREWTGSKPATKQMLAFALSVLIAAVFDIPQVFTSMVALCELSPDAVIYDIAVPGSKVADILEQLTDHAYVLLQKPMGEDLEQASRILDICRRKHLTAGVNFQLRYAPYIMMLKEMIQHQLLHPLH
jgi:predicted dehydrogenase